MLSIPKLLKQRRNKKRTFGHYLIKYGVLVVFLVVLLAFSTTGNIPGRYRSHRTVKDNSSDPDSEPITCENVGEGDGLIPYLKMYYCTDAKWAVWIFYIIWLLVLFYLMGDAAEGYFCPSLELIANALHMSPELAIHGVTILSLGNGVADVSSTVVAAIADRFELGIGETLGAGLFIVTVIVAAVSLVGGTFSLDRKAFLRDISFYLLAVFAVYFIWWDGKINVYECIAFLGYYVVYVMVAVLSHYCCGKKPEQAHTVSREIPSVNEATPLLTDVTSFGNEAIESNDPQAILDDDEEDDDDTPWSISSWKNAWTRKSLGKKIFYIATYIIRLPLILTTPTIQWNRYIATIIPTTGPLLCMLVLGWDTFTKTISIGDSGIDFPVAVIVALAGFPIGLLIWCTSTNTQKPKYHPIFVVLCFILSIAWIYLTANELIALLDCVGHILDISELILGATVLSWGNSIGDLVADVLMAKQGQGRMAMSAVYASPLFNMLVGFGAALVIATVRAFPNPYVVPVSHLFLLTGGFLLWATWTSLIIISLRRWVMHWGIGVYLLTIYLAYTILVVLVEKGIVWTPDEHA